MTSPATPRTQRIFVAAALALGITLLTGLAFGGESEPTGDAALALRAAAPKEASAALQSTPTATTAKPLASVPAAPGTGATGQRPEPAASRKATALSAEGRRAWREEAEAVQRRLLASLLSGDESQINAARQAAESFAAKPLER